MSRPLPPEVYRRRRIVLVSGVLGVVLVAWFLVRAVTGGDDAGPTTTAAPTPSSTDATELPEGTVAASLQTGDQACEPQKVRISPSVPADQEAGGDVAVVLTISTTAGAACVLEASASELVVVIDDGSNPVYDSTSCTTSILSDPVSLSPDWATVTTATWNGRVSGSSCSDAEAFVGAGDYTIKLGTLGGEPGDVSFSLAAAPPPPAPPAPVVPDPAVPDPAVPDPAATDPAADPEAVPVG